MLLKIKNQIINTSHIVAANFEPASQWEDDEQEPPRLVNNPASLLLTMTSVSGQEVSNFDGDIITAYSESDVIVLTGQDAEDTWAHLQFQSTPVDGFAEAARKAETA